MFRKISFGLLVLSLFVGGLYAKDIELCVYTSDKRYTMQKKIGPLATYLQRNLNKINVKFKIYPTYKNAIGALITGKCSIARLGPVSYILAKDASPKIKIVAIEQKGGKKVNLGHFVVSQDCKLKTLDDVRGRSLAFGNRLSTIGRFLAQDELVNVGITKEDLKSFKYFKRHDEVAGKVYTRSFDVGVFKDGTLEKYKNRNLKIIHTFKAISKPWVATSTMDKALFVKIQNIFLNLKDKIILRSLKKDGFLIATDSEFNSIRRAKKRAKAFN